MREIDVAHLLIQPSASVRDAIAIIDRAELQIVLVVDANRRLLGTVSDGDVRRGLLRGVALDDPLADIMNRTPQVASVTMPESAVEGMIVTTSLRRIPLVDHDGVVRGLAVPEEDVRQRPPTNLVVLMAGGLGTRLAELTRDVPKPLLRVGSKPILETILERFVEQGFRRFAVSVNYKAEMIEDYFGDGSHWGAEIEYLRETERLGTAGSLALLGSRPEEPFLVMNGDLLTKVDFRELLRFHVDHELRASMAVREYDMQVPFGVVDLDGHQVRGLEEKPVQRFFVNAGIYVLDPSCLTYVPGGQYADMTLVLERILGDGLSVGSFPIHEYWMDVGRIDDFQRANEAYTFHFASTE